MGLIYAERSVLMAKGIVAALGMGILTLSEVLAKIDALISEVVLTISTQRCC